MIIYQTENFGKNYEYRSNPHENWVVPPHLHEFTEIAFTKKGTTTVYVNGQKHLVPEGHLIFILPNQIHEYTDETHSLMRCAVFSNDHIPFFFEAIEGRMPQDPVLDLSDSEMLSAMLEETSPQDTLKLCGVLNLLCDKLLHSTEFVERTMGEHSMFYEVIRYISGNFRRDICLSDIAKRLGYHEKYLSTALHTLTNMNFRTFLASYRIGYAKHLLRAERYNSPRISDIAHRCGFSSINTFNRVFRELTGMTPSHYLKSKIP